MELGAPQKGVGFRFIIPQKNHANPNMLSSCITCCSLKSPSGALITHWTSSPPFVSVVAFRSLILSPAYSLNLSVRKSMKGVLWYWFLNTEIFLRHDIGFLFFFFPLRRKMWSQEIFGTWFIITVWQGKKVLLLLLFRDHGEVSFRNGKEILCYSWPDTVLKMVLQRYQVDLFSCINNWEWNKGWS